MFIGLFTTIYSEGTAPVPNAKLTPLVVPVNICFVYVYVSDPGAVSVGAVKFSTAIVNTEFEPLSVIAIWSALSVFAFTSNVNPPLLVNFPTVNVSNALSFMPIVLAFTSNVPVTVLSAVTAAVADCNTVVPVPEISLLKSPDILNTALFVIVPPKLSIDDVNEPLLFTSPAMLPVFVNVPPLLNAPPILPLLVNVPLLSTAPVILPAFATVPDVFVTSPAITELDVTFNSASALFNVTTAPVAFFTFTSLKFNVLAFETTKPVFSCKSIVDILVSVFAPLIVNTPAPVVPTPLTA